MESLQKFPLFAALSPAVIAQLVKGLPRRTFRKGEALIRQRGKEMKGHLLLQGKVAIYADSSEGDRAAVIFHRAPYIIGVIELWRDRPALGSVVAMEPCVTLELTKADYLRILHSSHQASINMVRLLSNLLYKTAKDRRIRQFGRVEHLVANTLCSFAGLYGENQGVGCRIPKRVNKSEIASMLGIARRSVIRAFETLEEEGLIQPQGREVWIPNLAALKKRAQQPIL